ncbi:MAG: hypothetical protein KDK33_13885 [Leptospiraceae bacterium]|nr:hypothetical protein [Leptospiraceae bacterium]
MRKNGKIIVGLLAAAIIGFMAYCRSAYLLPTGRRFIPENAAIGKTLRVTLNSIREMHIRNIGYDNEIIQHTVTLTVANPGEMGQFFQCREGANFEDLRMTLPPKDGKQYADATGAQMFEIGLKRLDPTLGPQTELIGSIFFKTGRPMARCGECSPLSEVPEGLRRTFGMWIPPKTTIEFRTKCEFYRGAAPEYFSFEGERLKIDPTIRYEDSSMGVLEDYEFKRTMGEPK